MVEQEVDSAWCRKRLTEAVVEEVVGAEGFELCIATFGRVPRRLHVMSTSTYTCYVRQMSVNGRAALLKTEAK